MTKKAADKAEGTKDGSAGDEAAAPIDFEASLEELEALVASMESGELSLDESLKAFERGIALTRACQTALQNAELKVASLTADGDLVDFEED